MGQTSASPVFSLYNRGDSTTAGRLPTVRVQPVGQTSARLRRRVVVRISRT